MSRHAPFPSSKPVRLVNRRVALQNSKWSVNLDDLEDDRGLFVQGYISLTPRMTDRPDRLTGVTVVPFRENRVVLLRTYRHALENYFWEAARGFIDPEEDPRDAALRELAEETGLVCRPENLLALGYAAPESSTITGRCALFAAIDCQPGGVRDDEEIGLGAPHELEISEVKRMLDTFEFEDVTTEIALRRYFSSSPETPTSNLSDATHNRKTAKRFA